MCVSHTHTHTHTHTHIYIYKKQSDIYINHPTDKIVHTMAFVLPVMKHWLEQEISCSHRGNPLHFY